MTITTDHTNLTGTYTIDPVHTQIGFTARHAMVTKVRGAFDDFEGTVVFDAADPAATAVTVTIQAAGINTRNDQRDEHLRSNDFLAMEAHPQITFASTAFRMTGEASFDLTGDLTIRGVTNTITIPFAFEGASADPFGNTRLGFEGSVAINRKDYGVTWNAALETGGFLVSDKIVLEFEVSAVKNA
ncbi:polyisoprenoid-binding protein [Planomonospora parontospora subsp. parontospora]|uniref:Polyisoprenoid-binding protein n=2 Tax=Planomonospora parontospora TaxID=58119 RepID=A0AA37BIB4_9ACTN|nr:YceI family protein [Planomonospora parontospora]GGK76070.1 polyisoprenoid-binding protein [Planomonospora parontospora]GII10185.1 polyisoprenoid-binding protein [Planomonospora parontospora subsp. parontospora]